MPPDEPLVTMRVAVASGTRDVPISSTEFRAWANHRVTAAAASEEHRLADCVYGYRDEATPYRAEWRRFADHTSRLSRIAPVVVKVDVAALFASIDEQRAPGLPEPIQQVMTECRRRYGMALLPGHRWARRTANLVLRHVDEAVSVPFARWQDDYWLAVTAPQYIDDVLAPMIDRLAELGLSLNTVKTVVNPVLAAAPDRHQSRWRTEPLDDLLAAGMAAASLAVIKRTLRAAAERREPDLLPLLPQLARAYPAAAPRVAMYLDRCADDQRAAAVLLTLLDERDAWVCSRWLVVAARHQHLARQIPSAALDERADHPAAALRGLVARVQRLRDEPRAAATPRIDTMLGTLSDSALRKAAPMVDTTL